MTLTNLLKKGNQTCKIVKKLKCIGAMKITLKAFASSFDDCCGTENLSVLGKLWALDEASAVGSALSA